MYSFKKISVIISIIILLFSFQSYAQNSSSVKDINVLYNPKTVEKLKGEITTVVRTPGTDGSGYYYRILLKTDKGDFVIHLGPEWYFIKQKFTLKGKDKVQVVGSKVTFEGNKVFLAASITKDGQTIKLRDEKGNLIWTVKK